MTEATEKQIALLNKLTHKDYTGMGISGSEANRMIKEITEKDKPQNYKNKDDSPEKLASIEAQTAFNGVPALVEIEKKYPADPLVRVAVNWALRRLNTGNVVANPAVSQPSKSQENKEPTTIQELMTWWASLGKTNTPSSACKLLGIKAVTEIKDISKAYQDLKEPPLVKEAKKLGAKNIEPEDLPF